MLDKLKVLGNKNIDKELTGGLPEGESSGK
jgi:hypothetical protein